MTNHSQQNPPKLFENEVLFYSPLSFYVVCIILIESLFSSQENIYFGKTVCSILEDSSNPVYNNFAIQESYNGELLRRRKECLITITSTNFVEMSLDLTVLLIVQLLPGLPTQCDRGPISSKATVQVIILVIFNKMVPEIEVFL